MFALLRRATEMFPRSRELAYEIMILQKRKKKKKKGFTLVLPASLFTC